MWHDSSQPPFSYPLLLLIRASFFLNSLSLSLFLVLLLFFYPTPSSRCSAAEVINVKSAEEKWLATRGASLTCCHTLKLRLICSEGECGGSLKCPDREEEDDEPRSPDCTFWRCSSSDIKLLLWLLFSPQCFQLFVFFLSLYLRISPSTVW